MIKAIIKKITFSIKLILFKRAWRIKNSHNFTTVKNLFPIEKVSVGVKTYGPICVNSYGNPSEKLIIGSYCSIAGDVKFLLGGEHLYKSMSTYPFKKYVCGVEENTLTKGKIVLHDDVWIGERCLILSGVTIGQGAIIAAGSIVAKDIPPYAIFAAGRVIKYRFSEEIIKKLLKIDFSKLNDGLIKKNIDILYEELDGNMLNSTFIKNLMH